LRSWCYAGKPRQHWQLVNLKRALIRLGAIRIGRAGRAWIWSLI
jgi:hypothetical protein